jgi:phytoene desaturase
MYSINRKKTALVIGAGFSGLSAATTLAQHGYAVTMLEKNEQTGGRARLLKAAGFSFDMGPSWYWMPDVMEKYFNRFNTSSSDYFQLKRLDPSYQVIFSKDDVWKIPADYNSLKELFESVEKGSSGKLDVFLKEAKYKYETGINEFVYKPSLSISEFADSRILSSVFRLDLFKSFSTHIRHYFKDPRLLQLLEFPVLFLGAMPSKTPALYSMMNYADMSLGTWYPMGGMHKLVEGMTKLAVTTGVDIKLNTAVKSIHTANHKVTGVTTANGNFTADVVVASADYQHVEQNLLNAQDRNYSDRYWNKRVMAPSSLIYYIGINKKLPGLLHHNLFFEAAFEEHAKAIYEKPAWPENPLYYVCCPSKTDKEVAPAGMENLFILIPIAAGLEDTEAIREQYFRHIIKKIELFCGETIFENIIFKRSYAGSDFVNDYNSYQGNAYGLANTLRQTAFMKPSIRSRKVKNLFFTGQLTVPGPGVPPSIISGQVVADYISRLTNN